MANQVSSKGAKAPQSNAERKQKARKLAKESGLKRLYAPEVWLDPTICKELELKIAVLIAEITSN